jgi:hypothetical protein
VVGPRSVVRYGFWCYGGGGKWYKLGGRRKRSNSWYAEAIDHLAPTSIQPHSTAGPPTRCHQTLTSVNMKINILAIAIAATLQALSQALVYNKTKAYQPDNMAK